MTIVSDEDFSHLQKMALDLGLKNHVQFEGPLSPEELGQQYSESHCFILNSHQETFSIVVAEALVHGLYLISSEVGIVPDLPKDYYTKIDAFDTSTLTEAMKTAISKRSWNGEKARLEMKKYKETHIVDEYMQLYKNLQNGQN